MNQVMMLIPMPLRGEYANQLLAAARELGIHVREIRSQSDGFLVPEEVHRHLFPSQYADPDAEVVDTAPDPEPEPEEVPDAEIRAWAADNDIPVSERGKLAQKVRDAYFEANRG